LHDISYFYIPRFLLLSHVKGMTLVVYENRVLKGTFGPKREEGTG
jgi:hypothetical protein